MSSSPILLYSSCVILEKPFHNSDLGRSVWDSGHSHLCFDALVYDQIRHRHSETVIISIHPLPQHSAGLVEKAQNDWETVFLWQSLVSNGIGKFLL